jgi:hypothetical protein
MVPGNAYTASVWVKATSTSSLPARVAAYTCANYPNDFGRVQTEAQAVAAVDGWKLLEFEIENRPGSECNSLSFFIRDLPSDERLWLTAPALVPRFSNFVVDKCGAPALPCPPSRTMPNLLNPSTLSFKDASWNTISKNANVGWDEVPGPNGLDTSASPVLSLTTTCGTGRDTNSKCKTEHHAPGATVGYIYSYKGEADFAAGSNYTVTIFAKATADGTAATNPVNIGPYTQCAASAHQSAIVPDQVVLGAEWVELSWALEIPVGSLCKSIGFRYTANAGRLFLVAPKVVLQGGGPTAPNMLPHPDFGTFGSGWSVNHYNDHVYGARYAVRV